MESIRDKDKEDSKKLRKLASKITKIPDKINIPIAYMVSSEDQ